MSQEPTATWVAMEEIPDSDLDASAINPGHGLDEGLTLAQSSPFPLDCYPAPLERMARSICEVVRVPESLAGCCVLGAVSASIGKSLRVASGPNRETMGNLYIMASAESGSGKSEAFRFALNPFLEFEQKHVEQWKFQVQPGLEAEKKLLKAETDKLLAEAKRAKCSIDRDEIRDILESKEAELRKVESELCVPILSVDDVTTEKLALLMSQRGDCMASLSSDAVAIVKNLLGRYTGGNKTDEGLYLKAFSGDFCRVDRIGREPVLLRKPCLASLWLTQPDKLEALLVKREMTDGGLIPRLLVCHTLCEPKPISCDTQPIPDEIRDDYNNVIRALITHFRLIQEPRVIPVSPGARRLLYDHYNQIVERWREGELRDISSYCARWTEQAWRLSVCLHATEWVGAAADETLSVETAEAAIRLADWFAGAQLEILSGIRESRSREDERAVLQLLLDKPDGITARDIYRARVRRTPVAAKLLLQKLEEQGVLISEESRPPGGGRTTNMYRKAA